MAKSLTHKQAAEQAIKELKKEGIVPSFMVASGKANTLWKDSHKGEDVPKGNYKKIQEAVKQLVPKTIQVSAKEPKKGKKETATKIDLGTKVSSKELKQLALDKKISLKSKDAFCKFNVKEARAEMKKAEQEKKQRAKDRKAETKAKKQKREKRRKDVEVAVKKEKKLVEKKMGKSALSLVGEAQFKNISQAKEAILSSEGKKPFTGVQLLNIAKGIVPTDKDMRIAALQMALDRGVSKKSIEKMLESSDEKVSAFMNNLPPSIQDQVLEYAAKGPEKKATKRKKNPRTRNQFGSLGALAQAFLQSKPGEIAMQVGGGTLGYMLPGLFQMGFEKAGITGWIATKLKTTPKKAGLVASTAGLVGSVLVGVGLQKNDYVKKTGAAMVIGAGIRFLRDIIDVSVDSTTDTKKKIRTAFGLAGYGVWGPAMAGYGVWSPAMAGYGVWGPAMAGYASWRPALGAGPAAGYQLGSGPAPGYQLSGAWNGNWQKRW